MKASDNLSLYQLLFEEMPSICLLVDSNMRIVDINDLGCRRHGYEKQELLGQHVKILYASGESRVLLDKFLNPLEERQTTYHWECTRIRKDGTSFWARDTAHIVDAAENGKQLLIVSEDISETRYLIHELERQTSIDKLTGLINRKLFDRHLEELLLSTVSDGLQHGLLYMDLEQLSVINGTCGRDAGDEFLRQISNLFQQLIENKGKLAYFGGSKFGLLLESYSMENAMEIGNTIIRALSDFTFIWERKSFPVSAGIGIAMIKPGMKLSDLYAQAETACDKAKVHGRNRLQVYDDQDDHMQQYTRLAHWVPRLKWAFDNDRFVLHRQPIQPISSSLAGDRFYEVLIRLNDEKDSLVLPDEFIPAAERYDLITRIDRLVTRKLLDFYHDQPEIPGVATTYFVNLSGQTLGDRTFIDEITALLQSKRHENLKFCFEITETAAIMNLVNAVSFINHFQQLGCKFALDDFGTGFSSFTYLKDLPVDFLKIDGGFIKNVAKDPKELGLVRAIHEVATVLGKQTIAECVETAETLEVLTGLGIDFAQGYHLQKPGPFPAGG